MITEGLTQRTQTSAPVIEAPPQLNEVVHDLKNCMSILLYWVETLDTDEAANDDREDLKKLVGKMNGLIARLACKPLT